MGQGGKEVGGKTPKKLATIEKERDKDRAKTKDGENGKREDKDASRVKVGGKGSLGRQRMKGGRKQLLKIGTWNVRGTYHAGALRNLVDVMETYEIDILALQETKQKGCDQVKMEGFEFFNSGGDNRYLGTGFIVSKDVSQMIVDFEAVSDRLCRLRLQGEYRKLSIINVHAPTEDKDLAVKSEFYDEVTAQLERIPKFDVKMVIGDMNSKIGREERFKHITGGKSLHPETNENGKMVIDFAEQNNMVIRSTGFDHKDIHKVTWTSPDHRTRNQIDHVLVEKIHKGAIRDVRSFRGADADSDHFLVVAKIAQQRPTFRNPKCGTVRRFSVRDLKDREVAEKIQKEIEIGLRMTPEPENIGEEWNQIEKIIVGSLQGSMGKARKQQNRDWFDEQCRKSLADRNGARLNMLEQNTEVNRRKYREARKRAKQVCRQKKRSSWEQKIQAIEEYYEKKEIRNFYQEVKRAQGKGYRPAESCRNKAGQMLGNPQAQLDRWAEYFDEMLNDSEEVTEPENSGLDFTGDEEVEEPSEREIAEVIKGLKNNKSGGENGITAEVLKLGGTELQRRISNLIRNIWVKEQLPDQWNNAIICPVYKKGDRTYCRSYRGITLLDVTYKVLARVIRNRLTNLYNNEIGEYQGGFRQGRGTADQIFTLKMIQNNSYEQNLGLHLLFIDFRQAYDSVIRAKLYEVLNSLGAPQKLIRLVRITLENVSMKVLVRGKLSRNFTTKKGLKQGDPLSTVLFNFVLEGILRESKLHSNGMIYHCRHQVIAYADDVTLIARSRKELEVVFGKLETTARAYGLNINVEKTKYMEMKQDPNEITRKTPFRTGNGTYTFEKVAKFNYLGVAITNRSDETEEIDGRITRGSRAVGALNGILRAKRTSKRVKMRLYRTVIRPAALYGCESWILTQSNERKLEIWERKVLRGILGGKKMEDGTWRRQTNKEVYEAYGDPDIIQHIKAQRVRWLGHVSRMPASRHTSRALFEGGGGKKSRGRPRKKWVEAVKRDLDSIGVKDWRRAAEDRPGWRAIVKKMEEKERKG